VACADGAGPVCARCAAALEPAGPVVVPGVDAVRVLMAYTGPARPLVQALKYRNHRTALGPLATALAERVGDLAPAVVTWVPADPAHRRRRGYDQAELLARRLGRGLGVPTRRLLVRATGRPQTGCSRADRLSGPSLALRRRPPAAVLVVDDVVTTGGSLAAAARVLRAGGARRVDAAVLAATPG
jgi:predicted amidophosphoribosyltransferase